MSAPTINIGDAKGIWRPVYAHRQALHATADQIILTAWRQDVAGLDLQPAVAALQFRLGEALTPGQKQRRDAAAAAVLTALSARSWRRTKKAIAAAAKHAHRTGWNAGHALTTRDHTDDTNYGEPDGEYSIGSPELSDHLAQGTATATLTAAVAATARRAGRAMADSSSPAQDGEDVVDDGADMELAADIAVSAAYGAGLLAAYIAAGLNSLQWITAGDERVCETCLANEAGSPYSLLGAPQLPAHPRCRCVLAPA